MRVWVLILVLVMLAISPALAGAQSVNCNPPPEGDWFVNETVVCSSEFITLHNGSLLINESGHFTLESSSTLQLNSTSDGEYGIEVNGTFISDGSTIESLSNAYTFSSKLGSNLTIKNSFVYDCGYASSNNKVRGVYIKSDGSNITGTTFENNYIAIIAFSGNNNISDNHILSNYGGLAVDGSDNVIRRNIIEDSQASGISAFLGEDLIFEHNVIKNNSGTAFPVMEINDSVINNNTFVNNTEGGFGVSGKNNNITNNLIVSNDNVAGLRVTNSENTRVAGNNILQNEDHGLYIRYSKDTLVKDTVCNQSDQFDIYVLSSEGTTFQNTNYTSFVRKWLLDVTVVNTDDNAINTANVVIKNNYTKTVFSGTTNTQGRITQQTLDETMENESGIFEYNPYSINVSKSGYYSNFSRFNLTGDLSLQITLNVTPGPPPPPPNDTFTFTILSPVNTTYIKGDLTVNGTLPLTVNSQTNISSCNYYSTNRTGSLSEVNPKRFRTYMNLTGISGGYRISFSCTSIDNVTNTSIVYFTVYPTRECMDDGDCAATEACITNWQCQDLDCVCGYASNHQCVDYECCDGDDCEDDKYCDTDTHICEDVVCECPEKISNHTCYMSSDYCCRDDMCGDNETCESNECIERYLSFSLPENLVLGKNISILVWDHNNDPVDNVEITVKYPDVEPPVVENYYTDADGVAKIPIKFAGRVDFVARKARYFLAHQTGEVPEPLNWMFVLQIVVLILAVVGIVIIVLKYLKKGGSGMSIGFGGGPLKLEKTISGTRVMLKVKNKTNKKVQDITIRDSVPRRCFMRCNVTPKVHALDRMTDILTWEILELDPKEEVVIQYDTRRANEGFSVNFENKEYKA